MEQKDIKKFTKTAEGLDFNDLKSAVREYNECVEQFNASKPEDEHLGKVKIVGLKKADMFIQWIDGMDTMIDAEFEGIPEGCAEFYKNWVYPGPDEGGTEDAGDEGAGEGADTKAEDPPPEKKPAKGKGKAKAKGDDEKKPKGKGVPRKMKSFDDILLALKEPNTPTSKLDQICLEGGTLEDILAKFKQYIADAGISFKSQTTLSSLKRHIAYRQTQGYLYEEPEEGKIKLVGFDKS